MKLKTITGFFLAIFLVTLVLIVNAIVIDGDLTDWQSVSPIVTDNIGDSIPAYWPDIVSAYVTHDSENLFLRVDNAEPCWIPAYIWSNVTIRTNDGSLYLIQAFVEEERTVVRLTGATSLTDDCKDLSPPLYIYYDRCAMSLDQESIEFSVPLADLKNPTSIDLVFWTGMRIWEHYDRAPDTGFVSYAIIHKVQSTVDIDPDTLNLKSNGKWITGYITLPEGRNVEDVVLETVRLDGIAAEWSDIQDGVYMAKFDRAAVQGLTNEPDYEEETKFYELTLTIRGELIDGTPFEGTDTIRVIMK